MANNALKMLEVIGYTCKQAEITQQELLSRSRITRIVIPRQVAQYLSYAIHNVKIVEIGRFFGNDHSTIIHNLRKVKCMIQIKDPEYMELLESVAEKYSEV
jgi:chromosomal replication initiator protein